MKFDLEGFAEEVCQKNRGLHRHFIESMGKVFHVYVVPDVKGCFSEINEITGFDVTCPFCDERLENVEKILMEELNKTLNI